MCEQLLYYRCSLPADLGLDVFCVFLPHDASAERGDATVSRLSVRDV